jgi:hypothetical protein
MSLYTTHLERIQMTVESLARGKKHTRRLGPLYSISTAWVRVYCGGSSMRRDSDADRVKSAALVLKVTWLRQCGMRRVDTTVSECHQHGRQPQLWLRSNRVSVRTRPPILRQRQTVCIPSRLSPSSSRSHTFSPMSDHIPILMPNHPREYDLTVRQEPKQARMCGVGGMPFFSSPPPSSHHAPSRPSSH